jgi:hypothetical protein
MILYSTRARIAGDAAAATAWAQEVTALVAKLSGQTAEVAMRVGGGLDIVWIGRYETMAAMDADITAWQAHPEYLAMAKKALDQRLFETATIESAIFRTL